MTEGYIKLSRGIIDWEWAGDPAMLALWVHLLIRANYEDKRLRGEIIKRGQLVTTVADLSEAAGLSTQTVRTCLARLKSTNEITSTSTNKNTIITISKYDEYQCCGKGIQQTEQQARQQTSNKRVTNEQQTEPSIPISSSSKSKHIQEEKKEIDTIVSTKKDDGSEEFLAFQGWIQTHTPEVAKMQQPFTESQYRSLQQNYSPREVAEVLEDMSNSANLLKKYKSAYLTCKSWLKMRRERRGGMPMAQPQRKPSKVENMIRTLTEMGIDPNDTRTPLV